MRSAVITLIFQSSQRRSSVDAQALLFGKMLWKLIYSINYLLKNIIIILLQIVNKKTGFELIKGLWLTNENKT